MKPKTTRLSQASYFITKIVDRLLLNTKSSPEKTYISYQEALRDCSSDLAYEEDDLVNVIYEKTKIFKTQLDNTPYFTANCVDANGLLSLGLALNNGKINVLDFGGACGAHYFIFKKIIGEKFQLNWNVVETKNMCAAARSLENPELHFYDDIQTAALKMNGIDLLFSSGALQSTSSPRVILKQMVDLNANYIFLTRVSLTSGNSDLITVQKSLLSDNGKGPLPEGIKDRTVMYPHTNMSEADFLNILQLKYRIKVKFTEDSGIHNVKNKPIVGYGLLLEKK